MGPQNATPERSAADRPYKPASITLIVLKSIVIAVAIVALVSFATRGTLALITPLS